MCRAEPDPLGSARSPDGCARSDGGAERLYHDTKQRVSTEIIGRSRLLDSTELVRIGEPLRPEYAA
jgi:hypothetical protein